MTHLKPKDLRSETIEELYQREAALHRELHDLSLQASSGRIEKPHRIKEIKKDIARLLTVLKEKENVGK